MKRVLSVILVLCLVLSMVPATVFAAGVILYSGTCGSSLNWTVDSEGCLTISGTGEMWDYYHTEEGYFFPGWFYYNESVTSVVIDKGVTSIGNDAFRWNNFIEVVTIPDTVTRIGSYAFECNYDLTSVYFCGNAPAFDSKSFYGVTTTAYYPQENSTWISDVQQDYGGNITWVAHAPEGDDIIDSGTCGDNLTWAYTDGILTISGNGVIPAYTYENKSDRSPWTDSYCDKITSVIIENGVTGIGGGFAWHTNLERINIGEDVTSITNNPFFNCFSLREITFGGDAPFFDDYVFDFITATAYYPAGNPTWTQDVMQNYGGDITWIAYTPEDDYRMVISPDEEQYTIEIGEALSLTCTLYNGGTRVTEWEQPQLSISHKEENAPVSYEGWQEQWAGSYILNLEGVYEGTAYLSIYDSVSGDVAEICVEVVPLDETLYDDPSKSEWITEHIQYAKSETYQRQVVNGFSGELQIAFDEIKDDWTDGSYNTLEKINAALDLDMNALNETEEYELLLTQILFSRNGVTSIDEMYSNYLTEASVEILKVLFMNEEFTAGVDDAALAEMNDKIQKLDSALGYNSDNLKTFQREMEELLTEFNSLGLQLKDTCLDDLHQFLSIGAEFTIDEINMYCDTTKECIMYLAAAEAYAKTSDAFGEMLVYMRSYIDIPSTVIELKPVSVRISQNDIANMLGLEMTGYGNNIIKNPFNVPFTVGEFSKAIENFYTAMEKSRTEGYKHIGLEAVSSLKTGTVENVFGVGKAAVQWIFEKISDVNILGPIKDLFNGTEFVIKNFTGIDEKANHATMVKRLYCMERIHYLTVNGLAENTETWGMVNSMDGLVLDRNDQYDDAVCFDEAVAVYRAIRAVAAEYAKAYYNVMILEGPKQYHGFLPTMSKKAAVINEEQVKLDYEWCHEDAPTIQVMNPDGSVIYGLKCPISVSVKDENGMVVAELTDNLWNIEPGYEPYFYITEIGQKTGEYFKTMIVPQGYAVSIVGTGLGEMDAVVMDYQENTIKYFEDVPVSLGTEGYFTDNTDVAEQKDLLIGGEIIPGETEIHIHEYGMPVFTWSENHSCTATFTCGNNDDTQVIACIVVSKSVYTASAVRITYTAIAKFKGQIYETTKTEEQMGVIRIAGADRIATSLMLADQLKETLRVETFDSIIVASALNFPDALTGSYLATVKSAPILLTYPDAHEKIAAYIEANLKNGGTVYILGGESAVDRDFENLATAKGMKVQRVAGSDRFGTNLAILAEAGISADQPILIATATGFADSLSASATGKPMLLVYGKLTEAQKEFLETTSKKFIIIGGEAAVSAALEAELASIGDVERVAGESRYQTSVKVAEKFIQAPDAAILAYARNFPDGLCGGPLAYALGAPLILTDNVDPSAADAYVEGLKSGIVVGGTSLISDAAARAIFDLTADAEITAK